MREIKFRAWDGKKMWVAGNLAAQVKNDKTTRDIATALKYGPVMQYTGLKDKNGVEIYEGDVVDLADQWTDASGPAGLDGQDIQQVKWNEDTTGWNPFATYDTDCGVYFESKKCEVIGNIYENPDLLEGTS